MAVPLHCWWCCHQWEGPDVHLPIKYDDRTKKFTTKGHFCSFECAKAYGMDTGGSRWGEILENLALFRKQASGKYVSTPVAPKRQTLQIFGGPLTIEEFRKSSGTKAPWVHAPGDIHMVHTFGRGGVPDPPSVADEAAEGGDLKLKRTKPLKRTTSKLESALGIKRVAQKI